MGGAPTLLPSSAPASVLPARRCLPALAKGNMHLRARTTLFALAAFVTLTGCPSDPATPASSSSSGGSSGDKGSSSGGGGGGGGGIKCQGKPEVGKPASTFSIPSMNGAGKVAVEPGKVTLVDFWATWCKPCEKSFPKYQEFYVKYKASGLEVAAVSVDDDDSKSKIPGFAKEYGAKFPVGWDEGKKIADCYKPAGMPQAYLVDKKGIIRMIHDGYHGESDGKKVEDAIKQLL
jgi:cytochrome c biogenesis protein CcmG, thiol:disulfide interchange protein DsbE